MHSNRVAAAAALALGLLAAMPCAAKGARLMGPPSPMGAGAVSSFAELDGSGRLKAIGVVISAKAMASLPAALSDGHHCFDANKDGALDLASECSAWHERILPLPSEVARRVDVPFKWVLANWNPRGHIPLGVFDTPHFDVHFYIEPIENIFAIERGTCGAEKVRCDQFATARKPLPQNYLPANFQDLGLVAPAMGNHLLDPDDHVFHGQKFMRHWIYGAYDGRVIFYEEMVDLAYMLKTVEECRPIQSPPAVAVSGYYPTRSCVRHTAGRDEYAVSLEGFALRQASPPGPLRAPAPDMP